MRLTAPATATEMALSSPTPGVRFQVLGEPADGGREVLAEDVTTGGDQAVALSSSSPYQSYLLWITSLADDGQGGYWAGVGKVELRGAPNPT